MNKFFNPSTYVPFIKYKKCFSLKSYKLLKNEYYDHNKMATLFSDTYNTSYNPISNVVEETLREMRKENLKEMLEKEFMENKNKTLQLSRETYIEFLDKGMLGDATKFKLNETEVLLVGTIYNRIPIENLYKLLNYVKPDIILIQQRPDRLLGGIFDSVANLNKSLIDENKYIEKLIREPWEIQTSLDNKESIKEKLRKKGIILNLNKNSQERRLIELKQEKFKNVSEHERLTNDTQSLISLWGEQKEVKILVSDLPELNYYEKIANTLTLTQIRKTFDSIFTEFPNNPDFEPSTPLGTAINLYPDIFLQSSDAYISQIIYKLSQKEEFKNKKIISFLGYGQTYTIPIFLNFERDRNSLSKILKPAQRYNSMLFGDDSLEVLVEKWAMISLILNGLERYDTQLEIPIDNIHSKEKTEMFGMNSGENESGKISNFDQIMNKNRHFSLKERSSSYSKSIENYKYETLFGDDPLIDFLSKKYARDDMNKTGFNSENFLVQRMKFLYDCIIKEKRKEALYLIKSGIDKKKKSFMRKIINDPFLSAQIMK
jgi:hypothetical protein